MTRPVSPIARERLRSRLATAVRSGRGVAAALAPLGRAVVAVSVMAPVSRCEVARGAVDGHPELVAVYLEARP